MGGKRPFCAWKSLEQVENGTWLVTGLQVCGKEMQTGFIIDNGAEWSRRLRANGKSRSRFFDSAALGSG